MTLTSLGDQAQGYMLRNRTQAMRQDIQRLTQELATGQVASVRDQLSGNYSFLTDVERKVSVLGNYKAANAEAGQFAQAMQDALGHFGTLNQDLSGSLISAGTSAATVDMANTAGHARGTLDGMVNALNGQLAGRSLFAGNATNQTPLASPDTLIADLTAAMAGAATPADMIALADTWFDDPAGFEASVYQGGADPLSNFKLSPTDNVSLDVRAIDPNLKAGLKAAAVASLAGDPAFGLSDTAQANLFSQLGSDMLGGQEGIVDLQGRVGFSQERMETISSRNAAEVTSLNLARNTLLEANPFDAATQLEEVQFQLQSLYAATVRTSQLSLVNFL